MNLKESVRSITYLKNNAADVVRDAHDRGCPLIVTQNGEARAVLLGVEQYDTWKRTLALLKMIAQGEADAQSGRMVDQKTAFARAAEIVKREEDV